MIAALIIISILFVVILLNRNFTLNKKLSKFNENELSVINLEKGGTFRIFGIGEYCEEWNLKVIGKHLYREYDYYWFELVCEKADGSRAYVEVEEDDKIEVSVVLEELSLSDIKVTPEMLWTIDDNEQGAVYYNGRTYKYYESDKAVFYKHCNNTKQEKFYYWDFRASGYSIGVEAWKDGKEFRVYYSQIFDDSNVNVYTRSYRGV